MGEREKSLLLGCSIQVLTMQNAHGPNVVREKEKIGREREIKNLSLYDHKESY